MTTAIIFYLPNGKTQSYTVGEDGVKKIFQDEKTRDWIILGDDNIVVVSNMPAVSQKEYKPKVGEN